MTEKLKPFFAKYPGAPKIVFDLLEKCVESKEHPLHHPEGTLIKHIEIVVERAIQHESKEVHFTALFHDITKHGYLPWMPKGHREGKEKVIPEGSYWQNVDHPFQAFRLMKNDEEIQAWMKSHGVKVSEAMILVNKHMQMKTYLAGESGKENGMKATKREVFKASFGDLWPLMHYFSTYCDDMKVPTKELPTKEL